MTIVLSLPTLPPSTNRIWRAVGGKVLRSSEYRKWLDASAWDWRAQAGPNRIVGPYVLTITAGRPDKRRRDIDNLTKSCGDLLVAAGIVTDDSLCQCVTAQWGEAQGVTVTVEPWGK